MISLVPLVAWSPYGWAHGADLLHLHSETLAAVGVAAGVLVIAGIGLPGLLKPGRRD